MIKYLSTSGRNGYSYCKTDAFEKRQPNLVLVYRSPPGPRQNWFLWRHFAVLLEVKRDSSARPNPTDGTTLTALATQLTDMTRLPSQAR